MTSCPGCGAAMREEVKGGVRIDGCAGCGGLWFDAGELEGYLAAHPSEDPGETTSGAAAEGSALRCPRCAAVELIHLAHSGVTLPACPGCKGIFVGRDALRSILRARAPGRYGPGDAAVDLAMLPDWDGGELLEGVGEAASAVLGFLADVVSGW